MLLLSALEWSKGCVPALGRCLPLSNVRLERIELLLELIAKDVDVEGRTVVHTPYKNYSEEDATCQAVPEPDGRWQHGEYSVRVLNAHKGRLLKKVWQGQDKFTDPGLGVGFAQPGEAGGSSSCNLIAAANGNEEVVGELPESIR